MCVGSDAEVQTLFDVRRVAASVRRARFRPRRHGARKKNTRLFSLLMPFRYPCDHPLVHPYSSPTI